MKKHKKQDDTLDKDKEYDQSDEELDQDLDSQNLDNSSDEKDAQQDSDCHCKGQCDCGENCDCNGKENCEDKCNCSNGEDHDCECKCQNKDEEKNYLNDLLRLQAEFDNYRKRMQSALSDARQDGFIDAIEEFIPALDSFKMATDMITDKNTLMGIKFIEKGILDTLQKMGVEEIDATGKFNPELHQAIDTDDSADVESGTITKVAYRGFTYKGKVIRYAQVVVKK